MIYISAVTFCSINSPIIMIITLSPIAVKFPLISYSTALTNFSYIYRIFHPLGKSAMWSAVARLL